MFVRLAFKGDMIFARSSNMVRKEHAFTLAGQLALGPLARTLTRMPVSY
jgi:hypothetical protein